MNDSGRIDLIAMFSVSTSHGSSRSQRMTQLRHRGTAMLRAIRIDDELGQDPKLLADLLLSLTEGWVEPSRLRWCQLRLRLLSRYTDHLSTEPLASDAVELLERKLVGAPRQMRLRTTAARACTLSVATGLRRVVKRTSREQTGRTKSVATPRAAGTVEVHHPKETSR